MSETPIVVKPEEVTNPQPDGGNPSPEVKGGDKTPPNELLKSLQDEREKRRILEEELVRKEQELSALKQTSSGNTDEVFSDEGKTLLKKIDELKGQLATETQQKVLGNLEVKYPALKDKAAEFSEFLRKPENAGRNLETAAKDFLIENDLYEIGQPRKGLEGARGGSKTPPSTGMAVEEIEDLRKNNFRKYSRLLREGKINIS